MIVKPVDEASYNIASEPLRCRRKIRSRPTRHGSRWTSSGSKDRSDALASAESMNMIWKVVWMTIESSGGQRLRYRKPAHLTLPTTSERPPGLCRRTPKSMTSSSRGSRLPLVGHAVRFDYKSSSSVSFNLIFFSSSTSPPRRDNSRPRRGASY